MPADIQSLLKLEVPIIVQVSERTMSLDQVLSLVPGAIVQLPKSADRDLDILVGKKPIGVGRAVKVGENFGVRVTGLNDTQKSLDGIVTATGDQPG